MCPNFSAQESKSWLDESGSEVAISRFRTAQLEPLSSNRWAEPLGRTTELGLGAAARDQ